MDQKNFIMSFTVDKTFDSDQFIKLRMRVCHDSVSPNRTSFTKEVMEEANKTLEYIPILAHVLIDKETGKPVFGSHDAHVEEDKLNDGEYKVIYDEIPIGVVPSLADNNCSIEEYDGLNYTYCDAYIWRDYSNYAEQLIEDAQDVKLSMEIDMQPDAISYDVEKEVYNISAYRYRGITLLNEKLGTGMKNAMATTMSFAADEDLKAKMIVLMEELQQCLRDYNNQSTEEGGAEEMDNMEMEVTETSEEIVVDNAADEEVVEEVVENDEFVEDDSVEEDTEGDEEPEVNDEEPVEDEEQKFELRFELSHDDIRSGLYSLLWATHDCAWILEVYNGYFIYEDYEARKYYKQSYGVEDSNIAFSGEPVEVFNEWLTGDEMEALKKLKSDYAALVEYKHGMEAAELKAQKDAIFARSEYSILANDEAFVALKADAEKYSIDELSAAVKSVFADAVIKLGTFSAKVDEPKKTVGFNFANSENEKPAKAYGGLFD